MSTYTYKSINEKNFRNQLAGLKTADLNQRERLQAFVVFAVEHARKHSNSFNYLDEVIAACYELTVGRPTIMRDFVYYLIEGVSLTKVKGTDERRFKKETKTTKIKYRYTDPDAIPNWWDWNDERKADKPKKAWSLQTAIENAAKRAIKEGLAGSVQDFQRQVNTISHDVQFAAIFADAGVKVQLDEDGEPNH